MPTTSDAERIAALEVRVEHLEEAMTAMQGQFEAHRAVDSETSKAIAEGFVGVNRRLDSLDSLGPPPEREPRPAPAESIPPLQPGMFSSPGMYERVAWLLGALIAGALGVGGSFFGQGSEHPTTTTQAPVSQQTPQEAAP